MDFNKFIGDQIVNYRHAKGISQEELAYRAGIDRTYMSSIERGKRSISLAVAIRITSALEINIQTLITRENGTYINGNDFRK